MVLVAARLRGCTAAEASRASGTSRYRRSGVRQRQRPPGTLVYGNAPDAQGNPVDLKSRPLPAGQRHGQPPGRDLGPWRWLHHAETSRAARDQRRASSRAHGYVAASINYRLLSPTGAAACRTPSPSCRLGRAPAQPEIQAAVRWMRAERRRPTAIDTERIAIARRSAGAVTLASPRRRSEDPGSSDDAESPAVRAAVSMAVGAEDGDRRRRPPAIFFDGTPTTTVRVLWAASNALGDARGPGSFTVLERFDDRSTGSAGRHRRSSSSPTTSSISADRHLANRSRCQPSRSPASAATPPRSFATTTQLAARSPDARRRRSRSQRVGRDPRSTGPPTTVDRHSLDLGLRAAARRVRRLVPTRSAIALHNAPALVRWNSDKRYLGDLAAAGVRARPDRLRRARRPGAPRSTARS